MLDRTQAPSRLIVLFLCANNFWMASKQFVLKSSETSSGDPVVKPPKILIQGTIISLLYLSSIIGIIL